jgi:hypothetical protein
MARANPAIVVTAESDNSPIAGGNRANHVQV